MRTVQDTLNEIIELNDEIEKTLDNLGTEEFDCSIPFHIEYNGKKLELWFGPESVEAMQNLLSAMKFVIEEDYL